MPLAQISQTPLTPDDWKAWGFAHMANHRDICRVVNTQQSSNVLTEYPLYPINLDDLGIWLYNHQTMHTQMDKALGIAGYNLLELDWTDPDQLQQWISFNVDEHIRACSQLGIG